MFGLGSSMKDFVHKCWDKPSSRRMLIFLLINLAFMVVEMGYGVYANSLGLISDAFHMLSDCLSIFIALVASYISSGPTDKVYTFGH
jgi:solute carrier family 30 (zinc transporter), member 5/7